MSKVIVVKAEQLESSLKPFGFYLRLPSSEERQVVEHNHNTFNETDVFGFFLLFLKIFYCVYYRLFGTPERSTTGLEIIRVILWK